MDNPYWIVLSDSASARSNLISPLMTKILCGETAKGPSQTMCRSPLARRKPHQDLVEQKEVIPQRQEDHTLGFALDNPNVYLFFRNNYKQHQFHSQTCVSSDQKLHDHSTQRKNIVNQSGESSTELVPTIPMRLLEEVNTVFCTQSLRSKNHSQKSLSLLCFRLQHENNIPVLTPCVLNYYDFGPIILFPCLPMSFC